MAREMAATLHGGREGWEMDVNFEHPGFVEDHHRTQQRNNRDASTAAPRRMSSIQLVETLVARLLNNNQVRPQQGHEHETPATASLQGTYNSAFSLLPNNTNAISSAAPTRRQGREGGSDLSQDAWNKVAHSVDDPSTPSPPHVNLERPIDGNVSQEHATLEEEHYSSNSGTQSWCPVMHAASGPKRSLAQGEPWCRICYEGGNLVKLGCRCKNELSYAHEECAVEWFAPKAEGRAQGRGLEKNWSVKWWVQCEICGDNLSNPKLVDLALARCKEILKEEEEKEKKKLAESQP